MVEPIGRARRHKMTIATVMVHLDGNRSNTQVLNAAGWLAQRLDAGVIGIAACQPLQLDASGGIYSSDLIYAERDIGVTELKTLQDEFEDPNSKLCRRIGWRSAVTLEPIAEYVAHESRSADLIITACSKKIALDQSRCADTGALLMHAGRPVLVVPEFTAKPWFDRVVIAWKDTREARRAIADALPLLKIASKIIVVEVAEEEEMEEARLRVEDVVDWLKRHALTAMAAVTPRNGDDGKSLVAFVRLNGAELIVAGAYGHGRVREWAFGGMTRDLLLHEDRMVFLSH
jgi:nucleotide-binding universal stress UspA family protein